MPTLVLGGCASARLPAVDPSAAPVTDGMFVMPDGARLPYRVWRPAGTPSAVVLALHGFNDSRDAWEIPAPAFVGGGIMIYAPDQRGFGAAPERGLWPGRKALVSDAVAMLRQVRARHPEARLFLMGESMGGAVAMLAAAARQAGPLSGTVLLAPAVWGRKEMNAAYTLALWAAATLAPGLEFSGREVPRTIRASDSREALLRLARDPLTLRTARVDTLRGLVNLMDDAAGAAPHMPAEALFLYGARDQIVPAPAMRDMWAALPAGCRRAYYYAGYHLLLGDRDRAIPTADVVSYIADPGAPLPSSAEIAAAAWLAAGNA